MPSERATAVPEGFSWRAYLKWNEDIRRSGISTRDGAEEHWLSLGHAEGRLHREISLTLR